MSVALHKILAYVDAYKVYERCTKEQAEAYVRMRDAQAQLTDYDKKIFDRLIEQCFGQEARDHVASKHRP